MVGSFFICGALLSCVWWVISLPGGEVVAAVVDTVVWGSIKMRVIIMRENKQETNKRKNAII